MIPKRIVAGTGALVLAVLAACGRAGDPQDARPAATSSTTSASASAPATVRFDPPPAAAAGLIAAGRRDPARVAFLDPDSGEERGAVPVRVGWRAEPSAWSPDGRHLLYVETAFDCGGTDCGDSFHVADVVAGTDLTLSGIASRPTAAAWLDPATVAVGILPEVKTFTVDGDRMAARATVLTGQLSGDTRLLALASTTAGVLAAVMRGAGGRTTILVLAPDLTTMHEIAPPSGVSDCEAVAFDRYSVRLAATCAIGATDDGSSEMAVFFVHLDGGGWTKVHFKGLPEVGRLASARWTPDGSHLLLGWSAECEIPVLYLSDPAGRKVRRLISSVEGAAFGSFDPGGSRLAVETTTDCGAEPDVAVLRLDGGGVRRLGAGTSPRWSPGQAR